jgi:serine/threonine protein phosphatase 1
VGSPTDVGGVEDSHERLFFDASRRVLFFGERSELGEISTRAFGVPRLIGGAATITMTKFFEIDSAPKRLFAIGDIHGCRAELAVLLSYLESECGLGTEDQVVFIGDYIDRGPDTAGVISLLIEFQKRHLSTLFLKGNHEDMFLSYLGLPGTLGESFLVNGGLQTLRSYGIDPQLSAEQVMPLLPPSHYSFLLNLESYIITPHHVLVHAGLNPLRDLKAQLDEDLFWIRDEFIHNIHRFDRTVIFGHTPYEDVMYHLPFKLGIDTGLVYGNRLSCIEIYTGAVYQVLAGGDSVIFREPMSERAS